MTKLPVVSGEETVKALKRAGFTVVRQKGSHVRLEKEMLEGVTKLPCPSTKRLRKRL